MALRNLRYIGDEILRQKSREVPEVTDRIRELLADMAETMYHTGNGAGLAACQVGVLKRLVVIDMGSGLLQLVNPVIVEQSGTQDCVEGCLSIPNRWGRTVRPQRVVVKALEEKLQALGLFPGTPNTLYDKVTRQAVAAYQRQQGLTPTGVATGSLQQRIFAQPLPQQSLAAFRKK